jgi:hypothetical protein
VLKNALGELCFKFLVLSQFKIKRMFKFVCTVTWI